VAILLLIRHGVTDQTGKRLYGRSAVHLSAAGREQALGVAERLRGVRLAALYSSPLDRCLETAAPIAEASGLEVNTVEDLQEIDYGTWTGKSFPALRRTKLWRRIHGSSPSAVRFPGGETLAEVQRRAVAALEGIAERHPRATVAVVSHGDVVLLALAHFAGMHVDQYQRLEAATASISAVRLTEGAPKVLRVNDTGTLEDLNPPRRSRPR
jgi:probable phosphomutase (TIGR03848 family)